MKIESRANLIINTVGLAMMLLSVVLKLLDWGTDFPKIYRIALYLLFFTLWAVTIRRRVVQRNICGCLVLVAALELFWILARSVKYEMIGEDETVGRYLWYLYYLPMLTIPALCLLLSVSMGKPENYRQRRLLILFPVLSLALFLLVLTNDLHSLVFIIPPVPDGMEVGNYSYGAGFIVIITYIGLCALASYGIILVKCRRPGGKLKRFLPLVPLSLELALNVLNIAGISTFFGFYQIDITMVSCFCITATLELCMQSGLILTNNGYDELFRLSGIRAVITDGELSPLIWSDSYEEIPKSDMKRALKAPIVLENGCRLSGTAIKHGSVLWQDDI